MNREQLRELLQQPYNRVTWQAILQEVFANVSLLSSPHSIPCDRVDVKSFVELGNVRLEDGKYLSVFEIKVSDQINILRNRVELRNLVAKYIDQETRHGVLVIFDNNSDEYRFTFAARESEFDSDGNFVTRETATKRYTYLLGPNEACTTPARRFRKLAEKRAQAELGDVIDAFSVEQLNDDFFDSYKFHYGNFVAHLLAGDIPCKIFNIPLLEDVKDQDKANKPVRDFAKRLLGRIVFLYFLQKKGWLGCDKSQHEWRDGDRNFIANLFANSPDKDHFHSQYLVPLFYETLNRPNREGDLFSVTKTRVPYLNGGLFEHEPYPVEKINFPAAIFADLLDFLGQYSFTVDENDPDDNEVGIDPEMLGHIFENLLEDNKDKGAYYTPKAVVQYMCQQSLLQYLQQDLGVHEALTRLVRFKDAGEGSDKDNWIRHNARRIEELLDKVKICDPAIGSGAFPIGLLQEIYWIKLMLDWTLPPADTKLKIIQNSIYGVDIDAGAVEIARLRFWLALVVDEEQPRPLPNLDYKIMQGDSLLESFEGVSLNALHIPRTHEVRIIEKSGQIGLFPDQRPLFQYTNKKRAQEVIELLRTYFSEINPDRKQELHRKIDRFVLDHIDFNLRLAEEQLEIQLQQHQVEINDKRKQLKKWQPPQKTLKKISQLEAEIQAIQVRKDKLAELESKAERPYFLWHLFFQDVFSGGGFDIVIANPPYVRQETIKNYKPLIEPHFSCYTGTADLFVYFYEQSIRLLRPGGVFTFISSNKYYRSKYGEKLRAYLADNLSIKRMIDFGDAPVFDAIAYASILLGIKEHPDADHSLKGYTWQPDDSLTRITDVMVASAFAIQQASLKPDGWRLESPEAFTLLEKIREKGTPLGEYVDGRFYYGLKTGLNEAFVVNRATRDLLIAEDPKSEEVLKPFLRGKDVKRWKADAKDIWLIYIPWHFPLHLDKNIKGISPKTEIEFKQNYPAIFKHLSGFKNKLSARNKAETGIRYEWYALQRWGAEYWQEFESKKLIIPAIERQCAFAYDDKGYYGNDKTSICVSEDALFLSSILNSSVTWWIIRQTAASKQNGYFEFKPMYLTPLPIPDCSKELKEKLSCLSESATKAAGSQLEKIEHEIDSIVFDLFDLTPSEIALIQENVSPPEAPGGLDNKTSLLSRILPALKDKSSYFSLDAIKFTLTSAQIELADDTLREYMSEAMALGVVGDAGRGWYSKHEKPVKLDHKPLDKLIREVARAFPLLDFCCWSTIQLNPYAQHLLGQPTTFLYAESDTLEAVADQLRDTGWVVWSHPGKKEGDQFVRPGERTVVLRPSIVKQPPSKHHLAPIEKVLVDLKIEAQKLKLMDAMEVQRIVDNVLGAGLLQITVLLGYIEAKREKMGSHEITH